METVGFIGAGNMAGAIVRGLVKQPPCRQPGADSAPHILLTSAHNSAAVLAKETRADVADTATLIRRSRIVVLAVKPHVVSSVLEEFQPVFASCSPLVVSLAAGLNVAHLEALLPPHTHLVRAMPNMAAAVGQSITAIAAGSCATDADVAQVENLLAAVGKTVRIPEKDFSTFIALAASSPAFVFTFIEALARSGVYGGIGKTQAVEIVTQAVLGAACTVQAQAAQRAATGIGQSPADLVDAVSSPGGTTIAGLLTLESAGFSKAIFEAFQATRQRDQELGA